MEGSRLCASTKVRLPVTARTKAKVAQIQKGPAKGTLSIRSISPRKGSWLCPVSSVVKPQTPFVTEDKTCLRAHPVFLEMPSKVPQALDFFLFSGKVLYR